MIRSKSDVSQSIRNNGEIDASGKPRKRVLRSYRRYFSGYTQYAIPTDNGKYRYRMIYTDDFYRAELSKNCWILRKFLYCAGVITAIFLFGFGAIQPAAFNSVWYVTVPQACVTPCLAFLLGSLFRYVLAKRDMEAYTYRISSSKLCCTAVGASICLAAELCALLACGVVNGISGIMKSALACGAAIVLLGAMSFVEKRTNYIHVPNTVKIPVGAIKIDYFP